MGKHRCIVDRLDDVASARQTPDPALRTLEVLRLEGGRYSVVDTYEGDVTLRAEPFDAVEFPLGSLWAK